MSSNVFSFSDFDGFFRISWSVVFNFVKNFSSPVNGGVDVKELFNSHIVRWIKEKSHDLLESCKQDKVIDLFKQIKDY